MRLCSSGGRLEGDTLFSLCPFSPFLFSYSEGDCGLYFPPSGILSEGRFKSADGLYEMYHGYCKIVFSEAKTHK